MTAQLTLRIDLPGGRLGHGKIALLEAIGSCGSIAAAGREFGMSYRRAWLLVDGMNRMFETPLVAARGGGAGGGGAHLTDLGTSIVALYRDAERKANESAGAELKRIEAALAKG
ncbi:LysR family transcriptional regulator [Aureimonas endophytica]|uniref:LysR family transcriptional regulator n=1 Tax=Aureimonas endophytica TaxID=2027858 RepID=A0A916ZR40_9HYPH|nr:LysR family transcriptional regulator [Aureimonas endophytica]GGE10016.1 LysR family transcriptional regulator [Aureimonas endophytica]